VHQGGGPGDSPITVGRLSLDLQRSVARLDGREIRLRPQSFEVLRILALNSGELVTKQLLLEQVWGDTAVTDDSLTQCLGDIRRALGDSDKKIVRTIPRRGFILEGGLIDTGAAPASRALSRKLAVVVLAVLAIAAVLIWRGASNPPDHAATDTVASIAVLPFADMTAAQDKRHLGEGLAEEILNLLARSGELRVIARTSSFLFAESGNDISTIAESLGVTHIIEGSVRQGDDRLRITVQLVNAVDNAHLWSMTYDRPMGDILAIQSDVANAVANELQVTLDISPLLADVDPRAHALVIQARSLLRTLKADDNQRAQALLDQALSIDPDNVDAVLEKARAVLHTRGRPDEAGFQEAWLRAIELTEAALAIDPEHPVANAWRGYEAMHYSQNYRTAARYLERAMALDPGNVEVLAVAINGCIVLGCYDRAVALGRYSTSVDPLCIQCYTRLSLAALLVGDYDTADDAIQQAVSVAPEDSAWTFDAHRARVRLWQGDAQGALDILDSGDGPSDTSLQERAIAYAMLERTEAFETVRQAFIEINRDLAPESIAAVEAAAGNVDSAFYWLERNAVRPTWERGLNIGLPYFEVLHDDPRWHDYLERIGMSPEQRAAIDFDPPIPD
jgi:TolB-like protein/DNA-binding winged helix-turn-helix (wHTH) protein